MAAKDTWKALTEPAEKSCLNCVHAFGFGTHMYCKIGTDGPSHRLCRIQNQWNYKRWEWDGK